MQWIQSPTSKLDHIYNCLKFNLADEIDEFYNYCGHKIDHHLNKMTMHLNNSFNFPMDSITQNLFFNKKDRVMDIDNL